MLRPILVCIYTPEPTCVYRVMQTMRENGEAEQVMKFLKGLNDGFELVRSRILVAIPLPDIKTSFNMATTHERQQGCGTNMSQVMIAQRLNGQNDMQLQQPVQMQMSNMYQISQVNAMNAMNFQHNGSGSKKLGNQKKVIHCTFYINSSHTAHRCYKKYGCPPNHKFKGRNWGNFNSPLNHNPVTNTTSFSGSAFTSTNAPAEMNNMIQSGVLPSPVAHSQSSSMISSLSSDEYEKLIYLLNNTQIGHKECPQREKEVASEHCAAFG